MENLDVMVLRTLRDWRLAGRRALLTTVVSMARRPARRQSRKVRSTITSRFSMAVGPQLRM